MKFSIIIPVYNVENYIRRCVDSIIKQSFSDYEILLIDDGSTDKSLEICNEYSKKYTNIKTVHKNNGGQSSARNKGTDLSQGEYIIYLDSDDFIMNPDFLMKISQVINDRDIVFFKHCKYFETEDKYEKCNYSFSNIDITLSYWEKLEEMIRRDAFFGMPWNKCVRGEIIRKNKIRFEEGLTGEDMDWNYNVVLNCKSLATLDEEFIAYRQRDNSVTTSLKMKNLTDFLYILKKWNKEMNNGTYSEVEKKVVFASLAKYYSNFLIMYTRINDKKKRCYDSEIKELSSLLQYGLSSRPCKINKVYSFLGFRVTTIMLHLLDKIK